MNDTAAKRSSAPRSKAYSQDSNEGLPSLFGRLGDELTTLVDLRLNLLKVEIREDLDAYVRRAVTIAIGGIVVAVGFALANVAFSFFMSTLFANTHLSQSAKYGLGFMVTGLVYLVAGGIIIVVTKRRLASQQLLPERSLAEFENDKQLVKSVIQG
ncbi:MAG TPA: phage holin family protein [Pyrinomonadaceae bacterium]|nr:phage holin family protein [Pyrinomonadaceae bacterium]